MDGPYNRQPLWVLVGRLHMAGRLQRATWGKGSYRGLEV